LVGLFDDVHPIPPSMGRFFAHFFFVLLVGFEYCWLYLFAFFSGPASDSFCSHMFFPLLFFFWLVPVIYFLAPLFFLSRFFLSSLPFPSVMSGGALLMFQCPFTLPLKSVFLSQPLFIFCLPDQVML